MAMLHTPAGDRWRQNLLGPDGKPGDRVKSLEVEQQFWKERRVRRRDEYADRVFEGLLSLTEGKNIRSVLEIGPGWGNYTIPLCRKFSTLSCVDVSPDNLIALKQETLAMGKIIGTLCSPWEQANCRSHDLVFGYNCLYRLQEPEWFLLKMQETANKLCVIGMNCPPELPWLKGLDAAGIAVHYTRQGCKELKEVLDDLRIEGKILDVPNFRTYTYENREALLNRARGFLRQPCEDHILLDILMPYHRELHDGSLRCDYPFTSQLLYWES